MEPLLNASLDLSTVAGATWDTTQEKKSEELAAAGSPAQTSSTIVVNLPERVTTAEVRDLARDLKHELASDQPWIILDLSDVREMDTDGLDLLLQCLKATLSRDGVVKLRGVSPEAAAILELTGVDRVLSILLEDSDIESKLQSPCTAAAETPVSDSAAIEARTHCG